MPCIKVRDPSDGAARYTAIVRLRSGKTIVHEEPGRLHAAPRPSAGQGAARWLSRTQECSPASNKARRARTTSWQEPRCPLFVCLLHRKVCRLLAGARAGKWRLVGFADRRDVVHTDINPWRKRSPNGRCHGKSSCTGHRMTLKKADCRIASGEGCSPPVRASVLRCAQRTTAAIRYQWTSVTSLCCLSNRATGMCCRIASLDKGVST
jgi:hypothetical protein